MARKPRIANTLEVNTMSGSVVMAKIAGTESTAKRMSVASTKTRTHQQRRGKQFPLTAYDEALAFEGMRHR